MNGGGYGGIVTTVLFLAVFIGIFYFLLIRPQRRRQQQHRELVDSLKRGDEVVTSGGICGKVKKVNKDSNYLMLEVEDGVTLRVLKDSIMERPQ